MSKGKKNVYVCQLCGGSVVTIDIEDGVTPFMIGCKSTAGCDGDMYSSFYSVDQSLSPQFEWYKPTIDQYPKEHQEAMRHHIENGGLEIRKIKKINQNYNWWVYSTAIADRVLMVRCAKTGTHGIVRNPTKQEWSEAFHAPLDPYPWLEPERVEIRRGNNG